jgi:hypothetical protein
MPNYPANFEDAIDFPCSPVWVAHYAEQGLTQDYPPEYYTRSTRELREKIAGLEDELANLRAMVNRAGRPAQQAPRPIMQPVRPPPVIAKALEKSGLEVSDL